MRVEIYVKTGLTGPALETTQHSKEQLLIGSTLICKVDTKLEYYSIYLTTLNTTYHIRTGFSGGSHKVLVSTTYSFATDSAFQMVAKTLATVPVAVTEFFPPIQRYCHHPPKNAS